MSNDVLSKALIQSMSRNFSVTELVRTAETLKASGQSDSVETLYGSWLRHNVDHPLAYAIYFNYSVILSEVGRLNEAREALEKALALNADFMPAYINLGRILERQGMVGGAVVQWSVVAAKLAAINGTNLSHKITALNQSARALEAANQDESAEEMLRQSLELDCHQSEVAQHYLALRQRQCKWPVVVPWERVSRESLLKGMSPLSYAAYTDDPLLQLAVARHYNRHETGIPSGVYTQWPKAMENKGSLRIGYLSSDLREHAVGFLMADVPGLHNRGVVDVFAYYCGPASTDPLHQHFKDKCDHFVDISGMDDAAAARRMVEDGIQILVDLNGYTREARLKLVALRPAPVIVNWLGYPGTMASAYHHYLIADEWIIPEAHEAYYSEKVLRLPCYQPSKRDRVVANWKPTRAELKLREKAVVYCCFNGSHKISRFTFERWLMIIKDVPDSVLWLLGTTPETNKRLQDVAASRGIAPERIVFADKLANPYHLARYAAADLFLDSTPYGAHTTASDALWVGVPVLTLSGRSFASRVCGSLVRSAGLPEMICETPEQFVDRAVALGKDPAALAELRARLTASRDHCALFDMPLLVSSLETLYSRMWDDCLSGHLPSPDLRSLESYLDVGIQPDHEGIEVQGIQDYEGWWSARLAAYQKACFLDPDQRRLAT